MLTSPVLSGGGGGEKQQLCNEFSKSTALIATRSWVIESCEIRSFWLGIYMGGCKHKQGGVCLWNTLCVFNVIFTPLNTPLFNTETNFTPKCDAALCSRLRDVQHLIFQVVLL